MKLAQSLDALPVVGSGCRGSHCCRAGDGVRRLAAERLDDLPGGGAVRRRPVRDLAGRRRSILSFLGYNFFFIDPVYTFTVARPHELLALFIFLGAAVLTSALAGRAREQAAPRSAGHGRRGGSTSSRAASPAFPDANAVAEGAAVELNGYLSRPVAILLPQGDALELAASWPPEDELDTASASAARWAYEKDEAAGAGTDTLPSARWLFLPLRSSHGRIGVLGVAIDGAALDPEIRTLVETVAELTATALERARLTREIAAAQHGRRGRAGAQHAAGLDQPRLPHASRLHPRRGDQPDRLRRRSCRSRPGRTCWTRSRMRRSTSTGWCATCCR